MNKKIKLIALDLDGTVLTDEKTITPRTAKAIADAARCGIEVVPVTGRPLSGIPEDLLKIPGIAPQYQIVVDRRGSLDTLEVQVELDRTLIGDTVRDLEALSARIAGQLASDVLISCQVKLCQPGSLPRSEGKAKRVIDLRK